MYEITYHVVMFRTDISNIMGRGQGRITWQGTTSEEIIECNGVEYLAVWIDRYEQEPVSLMVPAEDVIYYSPSKVLEVENL
jgi:hypothetical protein